MCRFPATCLTVLCWLIAGSGCSLLPSNSVSGLGGEPLQPSEAPAALRPNASAEMFQRIKEAKSQNAVVLQVAGDKEPLRVLPLPSDGRSVSVSDLLNQTGATSLFGEMQVRVYRDKPGQMDGVRMDVRLEDNEVRPECDYALHPGDRIEVCKAPTTQLGRFLGGIIPSNTMRAFER